MHSAEQGWASVWVIGPVVAGAALFVIFVWVEARSAYRPMMPLRLFTLRGVALGNAMLLLFGAIAIAMWYFTSLFMQNVLGYSALRAGLGQTPGAVTFMLVAGRVGGLQPKIGARNLLLAGCGCFLVGFSWLAQAHADSLYVTSLLGPTLLIATGIGLTFPTLMATATSNVPSSDAGIAGGLATTAQQVGGALGLAVLATAASTKTAGVVGSHAPATVAAGYSMVFLTAAGLGAAIAAASLLLPRKLRD